MLIVEDGTGLGDANAYATVEYVDEYHSTRGIMSWTGTTEEKETAIVRATDYIETRWGPRFLAARQFPTQALSFPRVGLRTREGHPVTGVPENVLRATAEYARRALTIILMPDPVVDDTGQRVASRSESVGPISESVSYSTFQQALIELRPYPSADRWLLPFVAPGGQVTR